MCADKLLLAKKVSTGTQAIQPVVVFDAGVDVGVGTIVVVVVVAGKTSNSRNK